MREQTETTSPEVVAAAARQADTERAFGLSIALAGIRCVVKYMLLPFGLPLLGISTDLAAPISLAIGGIALVSIIWSVRRLWQLQYTWKWLYLLMGIVSTAVIISFIVGDLQAILG
jgi:hypothetical protein